MSQRAPHRSQALVQRHRRAATRCIDGVSHHLPQRAVSRRHVRTTNSPRRVRSRVRTVDFNIGVALASHRSLRQTARTCLRCRTRRKRATPAAFSDHFGASGSAPLRLALVNRRRDRRARARNATERRCSCPGAGDVDVANAAGGHAGHTKPPGAPPRPTSARNCAGTVCRFAARGSVSDRHRLRAQLPDGLQ